MATYRAFIAGIQYPNADGSSRERIARACEEGHFAYLLREYDNPHDPNAIAVLNPFFLQLGYIDAATAKEIAPLFDRGVPIRCQIDQVCQQSELTAPPVRMYLSIVTPQESECVFVAGTSFSPEGSNKREETARNCCVGERMLLLREPENPHDSNAIAVHTRAGWKVGYIEREHAEWITPIIDRNEEVSAIVEWLDGVSSAPRIHLAIHTEEDADDWERFVIQD